MTGSTALLVAAIGVGLFSVGLVLLRAPRTPAPPPGRWNTDAITPAGAVPRERVVERVGRQGVLTQGVVLACEMARADGTVLDVERDAIRTFLLTHVPDADDALATRILRDGLEAPLSEDSFRNAVDTIRALATEEQRHLVLELLVHVAHVDGDLHGNERSFMSKVGVALDLADADVQALLAR